MNDRIENPKQIFPVGNTKYKGVNIGRWCDTQRQKFKKKKISVDRINQLNAISKWYWVGTTGRKNNKRKINNVERIFKPSITKKFHKMCHNKTPETTTIPTPATIPKTTVEKSERERECWIENKVKELLSGNSKQKKNARDYAKYLYNDKKRNFTAEERDQWIDNKTEEKMREKPETIAKGLAGRLYSKHISKKDDTYTAPNPTEKKKINDIFSSSISPNSRGDIIILDHIDFNTANALYQKGFSTNRIIIPNCSKETFEKMKSHFIFGKCVHHCKLEKLLDEYVLSQKPIAAIYADFNGTNDIFSYFPKLNLEEGCIIAYTRCSRSATIAPHTNSYISTLLGKMQNTFPFSKNLVPEEDNFIIVYGGKKRKGNKMATSIFQVNLPSPQSSLTKIELPPFPQLPQLQQPPFPQLPQSMYSTWTQPMMTQPMIQPSQFPQPLSLFPLWTQTMLTPF